MADRPDGRTLILMIDDDRKLCRLVSTYLEPLGFAVTAVHTGPEGAERATAADARWHAVILDVMLPGIDGFEVLRRIRQRSIVPVLMLTARGEETDRIVGLEVGADDYVSKPYRMRELVARMRAVMRRHGTGAPVETEATPGALTVGDLSLDPDEHRVRLGGIDLQMPLKEFELLHLLMANAGRVLTREILIDRVWGSDYVGDTKTLDVHVKRLRAKIENDPAAPTRITTIRGLGYKFERPKN